MRPLHGGAPVDPYQLLACAGITPDSSMEAIREAGFTLIEQDQMTSQAREAWDLLRRVDQRLVVDFTVVPATAAGANLEA